MGPDGWWFNAQDDECGPDPVNGFKLVKQLYFQQNKKYKGSITLSILYDKLQRKIVNNDSSDIIRMLNTAFNELIETDEQRELDLYPEHLRE